MLKQFIVLYFAVGFIWVTRGNPLQRLLSQATQNCNCPWNLQALLQTPQNGPSDPRVEAQNPTCPAQTCAVPSFDLNQLISPPNGPYLPVQNAIRPAHTFGVTEQPRLDPNQIIYDIILEKLGINRNFNQDIYSGANIHCNQDIYSGANRNFNQDIYSGANQNCFQDINSGVNLNYNQQNNRQCIPQVQSNNNIGPTSNPRPLDPQIGFNNDPRIVNNYIIVPPEIFQDQQQCNKKANKERRNRRQDLENVGKTNEKNNNEINETHKKGSDEKTQSSKEPSDQSDERPQFNKSRRKTRKRKQDINTLHGRETPEVTEAKSAENGKECNQTKSNVFDDAVMLENPNLQAFQPINELPENNTTELEITKKTEEKRNPVTTENTEVIIVNPEPTTNMNASETPASILGDKEIISNCQKIDPENLNKSSKNGNKRRSRKRKPRKGNNNEGKNVNVRPTTMKEDGLIKDFRKKFPNIPTDLLVKLIDYMKIKLQDDQSSMYNAFNNYWNYPIDFDQFYKEQFKNLMPNSEITLHPGKNRNNDQNSRSKNRKRRRKSKSGKNNNESNKMVELTRTAPGNKSVEIKNPKSNKNEDPITKEEHLLNNSELCDIQLNKTSSDRNKIENLDDNIKLDRVQPMDSSFTSSNSSIIENNTIHPDNKTIQSDTDSDLENFEEKTKLSDTIKKSVDTSNAKYVKAVNIEPHRNERIINIKISVEPQRIPVVSSLDGRKNKQGEMIVIEASETNNATDSVTTFNKTDNSDNGVKEIEISKENLEVTTKTIPTKSLSESQEDIDKIYELKNQLNYDSQRDSILMHTKLESVDNKAVENEINDYFPNFETDNFAYLLQEDYNELKHISEGRYHYTTEVQLRPEDSSENYRHVYKENPEKPKIDLKQEKLIVDLNRENPKTYSEIEDTIQKPQVDKLDEKVFITPPTLEVPDFETKPVKKDYSFDDDRFVFFNHCDFRSPNVDSKYRDYVEDKASAYSEHKNKSIFDKQPNSEIKAFSNNIETVFARSKVAKYGQKVNDEIVYNTASPEIINVNYSDDILDDKDKVDVVLAQSY